jgi:hypothetical protein
VLESSFLRPDTGWEAIVRSMKGCFVSESSRPRMHITAPTPQKKDDGMGFAPSRSLLPPPSELRECVSFEFCPTVGSSLVGPVIPLQNRMGKGGHVTDLRLRNRTVKQRYDQVG